MGKSLRYLAFIVLAVAFDAAAQQQTATLTKSFNPFTINAGFASLLTFVIINPASNNPAQTFSFADTLPSGLVVAGTPGIVNTCTGGTVTAAAGASIITVAGTTVGMSTSIPSTCAVQVNITNVTGQTNASCANNPTAFTNGNANISGATNVTNAVTASCLTVLGAQAQVPTLAKALSPATITAGGTSVLTFTITNPATNNPAQTFSFTDMLPTGLVVAATPGVVNGCTGGTISAAAGATSINVGGGISVGASTATATTCTISVNITNATGQANASCANLPAAFTNAAANIGGNSNITTAVTPACLVVNQQQANTFTIAKVPNVTSTTTGSPIAYTITVTNNGPAAANGSLLTDPAIAGFTPNGIVCTTTTGGAACPVAPNVTIANLQGAGIALTTFPANSSITFSLTGTFTATSGSTVNTATVSTPPGVPLVTASATATVSVQAGPTPSIPTLTEQALLLLAVLLAFAGAIYARRTKARE